MISQNKDAHREFQIIDTYEAGIVLSGQEVKAVKTKGIKLEGAYVKITESGILLINASIPQYAFSTDEHYDPTRSRKLLLHKKELLHINSKLSQGANLTIIPISCYNKGGILKVEIAVAKGKKTWEVKKVEQERDEKRRESKEMKEYLKEKK